MSRLNGREVVYRCIDGERDYQDQKWNPTVHQHSVGDFLVYIDVYLNKAKHALTMNEGDRVARQELRKVAALAVACLEQNGCVHRQDDK